MARTPDILSMAEIEAFTRRLKATIAAAETSARLLQVVDDLVAGKPSAGRGARAAVKTAAAGGKRRRGRRPGMDPEKVAAALKGKTQGLAVSEIAKAVGESDKSRVAAALRKLREDGKAKLKGEKRFARWFPA